MKAILLSFVCFYLVLLRWIWPVVLASSAATPRFPRLKGERPFAGRLAFD
jgi:hypothetical protein